MDGSWDSLFGPRSAIHSHLSGFLYTASIAMQMRKDAVMGTSTSKMTTTTDEATSSTATAVSTTMKGKVAASEEGVATAMKGLKQEVNDPNPNMVRVGEKVEKGTTEKASEMMEQGKEEGQTMLKRGRQIDECRGVVVIIIPSDLGLRFYLSTHYLSTASSAMQGMKEAVMGGRPNTDQVQ